METYQPQPIRLLRAYRGREAGETFPATPGLADHLVANGWAVRTTDQPPARRAAERAVSVPAVETRSDP